MKTLASITAVFAPLSFVASLFSMTIFTWQTPASAISPPRSMLWVSSYFWVYWVVAVPLTLLTLFVWRKWWLYEASKIRSQADMVMTEKENTSASP